MIESNGAGPYQHTPGLPTQVFLAYPETADTDRSERTAPPRGSQVLALRQLLAHAQISVWECPRPCTADSEVMISRATEACDNYLLVLSPAALADSCCLQGLLFARSLNKRIVPVVAEAVPREHLPEPLQPLDLIDLQPIDLQPMASSLGQTAQEERILQVLRHEADYHQAHTYLLLRALQWERQGRNPALLLQGRELAWYQRWLLGANGRSHHGPIHLQRLYIAESHRHSSWHRRTTAFALVWLGLWGQGR